MAFIDIKIEFRGWACKIIELKTLATKKPKINLLVYLNKSLGNYFENIIFQDIFAITLNYLYCVIDLKIISNFTEIEVESNFPVNHQCFLLFFY